MDMETRNQNEIDHGQRLAAGDPDQIWGWGSPAGRIRARRRALLISRAAGLGPGTRVLELGCGSGLFTSLFAETGATVVALDISPELIALARRRCIAAARVEFVCTPFGSGELPGPFDAIVGSSVLHHLDLEQSLTRAKDLLRPRGRLAFAEPNLINPQIYLERRFRQWKIFNQVTPDETAFSRFRLGQLLNRLGFQQVSITPFDWLHPNTPRPVIPLVRALGSVLERVPFAREFAGSLLIASTRRV